MIRQPHLTSSSLVLLGCCRERGFRRHEVEVAIWAGSDGFGRIVACVGIEARSEGELGFGEVKEVVAVVVEFVMLLGLLTDR